MLCFTAFSLDLRNRIIIVSSRKMGLVCHFQYLITIQFTDDFLES